MKKSYDLDCPVARTLDVIGERWTALILRDLFLKRSGRFQDLQESLRGVAPNILSDRLKSLESAGIIERHAYSDHPPRFEYALTDKGRTLGPIIGALRDWGLRNPS
jgi:DNA-binding HxlR family transcriptional regulator